MNHFVWGPRGFTFTTCFSDEIDGAKYLGDLLLAQKVSQLDTRVAAIG